MRGFFQNFFQVIALLFRELFIFDTQLLTHGIAEYIKKISGNTQCPLCRFITLEALELSGALSVSSA